MLTAFLTSTHASAAPPVDNGSRNPLADTTSRPSAQGPVGSARSSNGMSIIDHTASRPVGVAIPTPRSRIMAAVETRTN